MQQVKAPQAGAGAGAGCDEVHLFQEAECTSACFRIRSALRSADERTHLRVAGGVVPAPDVDEPVLAFGGGEVELSPGRRDHTGVLRAAVIPEQPT